MRYSHLGPKLRDHLHACKVLASRVLPESHCGFRAERSTVDMIFSIQQLQEKCREQPMSLYIAFIDLTKAFGLVSRSGLFKLLKKIGYPPRLLNIIASFHDGMQGTVSYNGASSEPPHDHEWLRLCADSVQHLLLGIAELRFSALRGEGLPAH